MELLRQLWESSSFRSAVKELVALPTSSLERLRTMVRPSDEIDESEFASLEVPSHRSLRAAETLRHITSTESSGNPEQVVDTLIELLEPKDADQLQAKRAEFQAVLVSTEEYQRYVISDRALRSIFPVLENLSASVDFRLISEDDNNPLLVPLISVRAVFDENVGGSGAVSFQMSLETAHEVVDEIKRVVREAKETDLGIGDR